MTAKEMVKNCAKQIKFTNKEPLEHFIFLKKDLESFVNQLCKEQREICLNELHKKVLMDRDETKQLAKIVILNAPQPNIFEEEK